MIGPPLAGERILLVVITSYSIHYTKLYDGATYQVPVEVRPERRNALAIRWIINFAQSRSGQSMSEKLAAELLDAFNSRGASVKKKDDTHKMAEA